MLEHFQRDDLNHRASRAMAVLHPLKLVIDNYPEGKEEIVEVANNPEDPSAGTRQVPFSRELYIEHDDFREVPPPKYYRLSPGKEVRLRNAYFVTAKSVVKDAAGNVVEVHCTYDPASRGGNSPDGRKVKSTMHWVSAAHAISAEIRLYDKLFSKPDPYDFPEGGDIFDNLNPNSLEILTGAKLEPSLASAKLEDRFQFERVGYFCLDPDSTGPENGLQSDAAAERLLGQDREEGWELASELAGLQASKSARKRLICFPDFLRVKRGLRAPGTLAGPQPPSCRRVIQSTRG